MRPSMRRPTCCTFAFGAHAWLSRLARANSASPRSSMPHQLESSSCNFKRGARSSPSHEGTPGGSSFAASSRGVSGPLPAALREELPNMQGYPGFLTEQESAVLEQLKDILVGRLRGCQVPLLLLLDDLQVSLDAGVAALDERH